MASKAAMRRLQYILADEEYGPKFARLRGNDERRILDLIDAGRGKEARAAILEADERRRTRARGPQRVTDRERKERAAISNILRVFERKASERTVRRNVSIMTGAELDFAADATAMELTNQARQPPTRSDSRGKDVNPFWYH